MQPQVWLHVINCVHILSLGVKVKQCSSASRAMDLAPKICYESTQVNARKKGKLWRIGEHLVYTENKTQLLKTFRDSDSPMTVSNSFRERHFIHNYPGEEKLFLSIHSTVYILQVPFNPS